MRFFPVVRRSDSPSWPWPEATPFFDEFFNDFPLSKAVQTNDHWAPVVDILEKDGNLVLRAELPGMEQKDINLQIEGNILTLKGEKKFESEEKRDVYHRRESIYGNFSRSFSLPESVDREKIHADYKNGILTITIPQKPEVKPREIPVAVQ